MIEVLLAPDRSGDKHYLGDLIIANSRDRISSKKMKKICFSLLQFYDVKWMKSENNKNFFLLIVELAWSFKVITDRTTLYFLRGKSNLCLQGCNFQIKTKFSIPYELILNLITGGHFEIYVPAVTSDFFSNLLFLKLLWVYLAFTLWVSFKIQPLIFYIFWLSISYMGCWW